MSELAQQIEAAFDYRGYVTVSKKDGSQIVGFMYDRTPARVELFDETGKHRIAVATADIERVELTGDDTAAKATQIWERRVGKLEAADTSAYGDWDAQRGALAIVAMPRELTTIAHAIGAKARRDRVLGALGATAVAAVAIGIAGDAARAISSNRPRVVVGAGYAGALAASLQTGQLVIAASVRRGDEVIAADAKLIAAARAALPDAIVGELVHASQVATTHAQKQQLARSAPGAIAADMETFAIARAARDAKLPWLALRVVLDPLAIELPAFTATAREHFVAPAIRHALTGPRAVAQLIDLARRARTADRALARAFARLADVVAA